MFKRWNPGRPCKSPELAANYVNQCLEIVFHDLGNATCDCCDASNEVPHVIVMWTAGPTGDGCGDFAALSFKSFLLVNQECDCWSDSSASASSVMFWAEATCEGAFLRLETDLSEDASDHCVAIWGWTEFGEDDTAARQAIVALANGETITLDLNTVVEYPCTQCDLEGATVSLRLLPPTECDGHVTGEPGDCTPFVDCPFSVGGSVTGWADAYMAISELEDCVMAERYEPLVIGWYRQEWYLTNLNTDEFGLILCEPFNTQDFQCADGEPSTWLGVTGTSASGALGSIADYTALAATGELGPLIERIYHLEGGALDPGPHAETGVYDDFRVTAVWWAVKALSDEQRFPGCDMVALYKWGFITTKYIINTNNDTAFGSIVECAIGDAESNTSNKLMFPCTDCSGALTSRFLLPTGVCDAPYRFLMSTFIAPDTSP